MTTILAYVDPGTGATMMQLVLAGTVGVSAIIKLKWNSIRALFDRSSTSGDDAGVSEAAEDSRDSE